MGSWVLKNICLEEQIFRQNICQLLVFCRKTARTPGIIFVLKKLPASTPIGTIHYESHKLIGVLKTTRLH